MFYAGLDLGQKKDHTAIVVVERIDHRRAFQNTAFERLDVRYAERMPLGMPYPRIVERVRDIMRSDDLLGRCPLAVDATGVGAPVVDMLRAEQLGSNITAYTITGGENASANSIPKRDLMAQVLVLLENQQLKIGKLREGARLMAEMANIRMVANGYGRGRIGAEGAGEHDDLVIALGLACWHVKGGGRTVGERSHNYF